MRITSPQCFQKCEVSIWFDKDIKDNYQQLSYKDTIDMHMHILLCDNIITAYREL